MTPSRSTREVRYRDSIEPVATDGRDIDPEIAQLSGEAASQEAEGSPDVHVKSVAQTWQQLPSVQPSDPTYYGRPLLKEPVWKWPIPLYYYVGGLTGAALVLGAAAQSLESGSTRILIRRCHSIGFIGAGASAALLVYDLGRPSRFFNMLRVFRPTSPMNMGVWILSGAGSASVASVLLGDRSAACSRLSKLCGYAAGIAGMGLASYTGVLVSNSAIPLWQESRRFLPVLFGASAMSSLGSAFEMLVKNPEERRVTKAFGVTGQLLEVAVAIAMERHVSVVPRVARPLSRGFSGFIWKAASALTIGSLLIGVLPKRSRCKSVVAGVLGTAGSLLMRFAVQHVGVISARDARASFHQQRASGGTRT